MEHKIFTYVRPYLYNQKFTIITAHRLLSWGLMLNDPSSRRWRLILSKFKYNVVYRRGVNNNNNNNDLSRIEIKNTEETFSV